MRAHDHRVHILKGATPSLGQLLRNLLKYRPITVGTLYFCMDWLVTRYIYKFTNFFLLPLTVFSSLVRYFFNASFLLWFSGARSTLTQNYDVYPGNVAYQWPFGWMTKTWAFRFWSRILKVQTHIGFITTYNSGSEVKTIGYRSHMGKTIGLELQCERSLKEWYNRFINDF